MTYYLIYNVWTGDYLHFDENEMIYVPRPEIKGARLFREEIAHQTIAALKSVEWQLKLFHREGRLAVSS